MELLKTIITNSFTLGQFLLVLFSSVFLGFLVSLFYIYKNRHSKTLALALVLIPAIETVVILAVNGNLGSGIAVAGSFSLVRFRSIKGNAREMACIFLSMTIGIVCGTGYILLALIFTLIILLIAFILTFVNYGEEKTNKKCLKITIPEDLNYKDAFEKILIKYTNNCKLLSVKTVNLGSLFKVKYEIILKDDGNIKEMIDELRIRNGNLEIICSDSDVCVDETNELWKILHI